VPEPPPDAGLPPTLAIAWGRSTSATRGPKPGLRVEAIVEAAIDVADAEGLAAVSMSKVAERLGYTPMSLYRYVPSKDDLLALVQDAALGEPPPGLAAQADWRHGLGAWAREILVAYRAHPWVLDIPIAGAPAMPCQIAWLEAALALLAGTPLQLTERLSVALLLSGYSRNWAQLTRDLEHGRRRTAVSESEAAEQYRRVLAELVTEDRFPATWAAITQGLFGGDEDEDDEFEFGLQRILDGIAAYIDG
jgi:AcrR family transcriptional regulator